MQPEQPPEAEETPLLQVEELPLLPLLAEQVKALVLLIRELEGSQLSAWQLLLQFDCPLQLCNASSLFIEGVSLISMIWLSAY